MDSLNNLVEDFKLLSNLQSEEIDDRKVLNLIKRISCLVNVEANCATTITRDELLRCITLINPINNVIVQQSCLLILQLNEKKHTIENGLFTDLIMWLDNMMTENCHIETINVLCALKNILLTQTVIQSDHLEWFLDPKKSKLLRYLDQLLVKTEKESANLTEEIKLIVEIIDVLLYNELNAFDESTVLCCKRRLIFENVAKHLLRIYFTKNINLQKPCFLFLPNATMPLLTKITAICPEFSKLHIGELLALIKAYMHIGIRDEHNCPIYLKKLYASQQYNYNLEEVNLDENFQSTGGKISKSRKPRIIKKNARTNELNEHSSGGFTTSFNAFDIKTSKSETEVNHDNYCLSKIRLAVLAMLGILVKILGRNIFYGYWYAFFPNNSKSMEGVLCIVIRDPNIRCRIAALQVTTQILFGSKSFLEQAEMSHKPPTSYLPFSLTLGQTVHAMYDVLSEALANESSILVLAQVLKCLAILVQATPFHRLRCGFVLDFVQHIQKLVAHRDASIQVSALLVMELLISAPKITKEISEVIGIPVTKYKNSKINQNILNDKAGEHLDELVCFEEFLESDDEYVDLKNVFTETGTKSKTENPWLLTIVLKNLNYNKENKVPASIKIESLQVITSMTLHFSLLIYKLQLVALALQNSLLDSLPDVRLYASKCLDSLGYNMNQYLLNNSLQSNDEIVSCESFLTYMLPIVRNTIRDGKQTNSLKVFLCDFLSNICVIVYNRLPHQMQINLLGFLSGIGSAVEEDTTVRAAAVRALAIFALFPSLRSNLVFLENTAELTILLVADSNLHVRIKALWSIGNLSDALISHYGSVCNERITGVLLNRLINVATDACNDHDKVRCNAVRALGNLLCLSTEEMLENINYRRTIKMVVWKLEDCIISSGNAKVKWNSCYAIGCLMKNDLLLKTTNVYEDFTWYKSVFPALCYVITHHANFKVRINATVALLNINKRSYFHNYFELCWCSLLSSLEKSYNIANYLEYNHRDNLQERLCIALNHMTHLASDNDCLVLKEGLVNKIDIIKEIWFRVVNRMAPENATPLLSCPVLLEERLKSSAIMSIEQRNAIRLIAQTFTIAN